MSNYLEQGKTFLEKKEYSKAMEFFQAAIEKEINNAEAHILLGRALLAKNKILEAKKISFGLFQ